MSEIKNGGLDQYGAGPFEQQQFETAGMEGVNKYENAINVKYFTFKTFTYTATLNTNYKILSTYY